MNQSLLLARGFRNTLAVATTFLPALQHDFEDEQEFSKWSFEDGRIPC